MALALPRPATAAIKEKRTKPTRTRPSACATMEGKRTMPTCCLCRRLWPGVVSLVVGAKDLLQLNFPPPTHVCAIAIAKQCLC